MTSVGRNSDEARLKSRRLVRLTFNIHFPTWALGRAFDLLPEDTMIVRCGYEDFQVGLSTLILWSSEFEPTPQHMVLTELKILVTEHRERNGESHYDVKLTKWDNVRNEDVECEFR